MGIFSGFTEPQHKSILNFHSHFLKMAESDVICLLGDFGFGREYQYKFICISEWEIILKGLIFHR